MHTETSGTAVSRRALLRGGLTGVAGLALGGTLLSACGGSAGGAGDGKTLVFTGFGGDFQKAMTKAWLDPFSKETGVKILQEEPSDYAKLQTMVDAGKPTWSVVNVGGDFGLGDTVRLLEPLDCGEIECATQLGVTTDHRVPLMVYARPIVFRRDRLSGGTPRTWADVWDTERFPGKRAFDERLSSSATLEAALIADGVAPRDLYPLDVERALRKFDEIRRDVIWFDSSDRGQQLFVSGEATVGHIPSGRIKEMAGAGVDVGASWLQFGLNADYLVIPRGTANLDAAQRLVAYITSAEHNANLSNYFAYAPANREAVGKVNAEAKPYLATTYLDQDPFTIDDEWWNENRRDVEVTFREWQSR